MLLRAGQHRHAARRAAGCSPRSCPRARAGPAVRRRPAGGRRDDGASRYRVPGVAAGGTCSARCGCGWSTRSAWSSAAPSAPTPPRSSSSPGCCRWARPARPAGQGGGGEGGRRSIAVHGEDDVSTREYRHGDDLRKVHWRATARTGELMVRLEERPWRARRRCCSTPGRARTWSPAHCPGGRAPGRRCPPPDSLEWLIEAAASIGSTLAGRGAVLRTVTDVEELTPDSGRGAGPEDLLDRLATLRPSRGTGLRPAIELLAGRPATGPWCVSWERSGPTTSSTSSAAARGRPPTPPSSWTWAAGWTPGLPDRAAGSRRRHARPWTTPRAARPRGCSGRRAGGWRSPGRPDGRRRVGAPRWTGAGRRPGVRGGGTARAGDAGMNGRSGTAGRRPRPATVLGSLALVPVFVTTAWLPVAATGGGPRAGRAAAALRPARPSGRRRPVVRSPRAEPAALVLAPLVQLPLGCLLEARFAGQERLLGGLLPTPTSLRRLGQRAGRRIGEIREQATPALTLAGLVALTRCSSGSSRWWSTSPRSPGGRERWPGSGCWSSTASRWRRITGGIGVVAVVGPAAGSRCCCGPTRTGASPGAAANRARCRERGGPPEHAVRRGRRPRARHRGPHPRGGVAHHRSRRRHRSAPPGSRSTRRRCCTGS